MARTPQLGFNDPDQYTPEGEFYRSRSPEQVRLDEKRDYAFGGGLLKGITELPLDIMEFMSPEDEYIPGALAPDQSSARQRIRTERLHGEQFYEGLKADPDTRQAAEVGYGASMVVDPVIDTGIGLAPHLVKGFKAIAKGEKVIPKLQNVIKEEIGAVGDIVYHGTDQDVKTFDPSKFGTATGAKSAKQGIWVVSEPGTAHGYADFAAFNRPVAQKMKQAEEAEKVGDWDAYDDYLREAEELESAINNERRRGQNIMPLKYEGDYKTVDMEGAEFMERQEDIDRAITSAQREGKDGVIFQNLSDDAGFSNRPAEHTVVFDPKNIKSAFEPSAEPIPIDTSEHSLRDVLDVSRGQRPRTGEDIRIELEQAREALKQSPDDRNLFRARNRLQREYDAELTLQRKEQERKSAQVEKVDEDYQGQHQPALREEGVKSSGDDLSDIYPEDIYGMQGAQYYGHGGPDVAMDNVTIGQIRAMRGKPEKGVFIYRAIPKDVDAKTINAGDWVTTNRDYAKQHGESALQGDYKILKKKVKAKEIFTSGDSIHEWGYDPIDAKVPVDMSKTSLREVMNQ